MADVKELSEADVMAMAQALRDVFGEKTEFTFFEGDNWGIVL